MKLFQEFNDNSKDLQKPCSWLHLTAFIVQQSLGQYKGKEKKKLRPNQLYITQCPNQERDSNAPQVLKTTLASDPFWNPKRADSSLSRPP